MALNGWSSGDPWAQCDVCGLKYRHSEMRRRWDNAFVCPQDFEERHPQERPRVARDIQTVKNARPRVQTNAAAYPFLTDENGDDIRDGSGDFGGLPISGV
jgi:hypothetical protein